MIESIPEIHAARLPPRIGRVVAVLLASLAAGCADPVAPQGGVDFDALFRPATSAEIRTVEREWAARDVAARRVVEEGTHRLTVAGAESTARIFSHEVDGHRHYGAVIVADGAALRSLPVLVLAHTGDAGVDLAAVARTLTSMGEGVRSLAVVVPSFRSETLRAGGLTYQSEGTPSPWDRDVDDALALLNVALERTPEANPARIGALGTSRGATVALLMAIRDPRIELVSEMAGPTDFLDPWVRGLLEEALRGEARSLPGLAYLEARLLRPLAEGTATLGRSRLELVRRSPVLWAARLPSVQVHHGTADATVPVAQAEALITALARHDRSHVWDDFVIYPELAHSTPAFDHARALDFLNKLHPMPATN